MDQARQAQAVNRPSFGGMMLLLLYNTVASMGLLMALPVVLPWVMASFKRRRTLRQRLGWWRYPWQSSNPVKTRKKIWVHALSVGEVSAAYPLVERIRDRHPELQIVVTASTLTGFQTASRLFAGRPVELAYFPYDWIWSVRTVASKIDAQAVILVETDIWPNFLAEMNRRRVPVYLVNVRLSDGAWKRYRQLKWVAGQIFGAFEKICVQTAFDARRFIRLGVAEDRLYVSGNIKFDGVIMGSDDNAAMRWRRKLKIESTRQIIVAGSTHEGEEQFLLNALTSLKDKGRGVRLIVVPRDPGRAQEVLALCGHKGLVAGFLSQVIGDASSPLPEVIVVDFIGVLKDLYGLSDVAFVGGSLVKEGGHNPLEPAILGKPVIFGPDMRDFRQIADWLLQADGARQVADQKELTSALWQLLDDPQLAASMGNRARQMVLVHQGAVQRTLQSLGMIA